jgi:D-amino peptidase
MKLMILTDIEGVTGVTTYEQAEGTAFGQSMLMNDLTALLDGIFSYGSPEVVIYDEHTDGRNVVLDGLPEQVSVVCGKPLVGGFWEGIDSTYDGLIMLGFHARSGVAGSLLPHSYSRKNLNIWINDQVVGEIGVEASMAGDHGVPLIMVTGDSAGMKEAQDLVPGVTTVTVKEALGEFEARCYSPVKTKKMIYEAAAKIAEKLPDVKPLKFKAPITLKIEIAESDYLKKMKTLNPEIFIEKNIIQLRGKTVTEVWMEFLKIQKRVKTK